jgi:hypothetical protein
LVPDPNLFVSDFQGLVGEDGQLHIMDPQGVDLHSDRDSASQLDILQGVRQKTQVFSCQAILVALSLLFLAQQYEHDGMFF